MELLVKIGRYAGEIRDFEPAVAHEMIADGRGVDMRFESGFASGGEIAGNPPVLVGESVSDHVLPRALVEKLVKASESGPKRRKS